MTPSGSSRSGRGGASGRGRSASPRPPGIKVVRSAIQAGTYAPAYVLFGDEEFLKEQAIGELLDAAIDGAMKDFNVETLRGGDVDGESLARLLATPPMLAERRAIVLRDAHALRKAPRTALDAYLARPASDLLLVLVIPAGQKEDAALLRAAEPCAFDALTPDQVARWLAHHAERTHGATLTDAATSLLLQAVGTDLHALSAELDKCASYALGVRDTSDAAPVVDDVAVTAVVGIRRGETMSDLLDAVALHETARAVELVPFVLAQPKTSGVQFVMALGTQMLALSWGRARRDAGTSASALSREFFGFLKESGAFPGRPWGEAANAWARAVDRWDADALRRARRLVLDADITLKDTRLSSDEQVLTSLVLALGALVPRGRRSARGRAA